MTDASSVREQQADPSLFNQRDLVVNATTAFVAAQLLVVLVHELSHVAAGLALGYGNQLFPYGVIHTPTPGVGDAAVMALTGPSFSLLTGLIALFWQPLRREHGFGQLLWVWFAHVSVMEGIGYLVLTPFGVGDTGSTAAAAGVSPVLTWLCLAVGVLGMLWLARRFARSAVRHTPGDLRSVRGFGFFCWIPGVVVAIALQLLVFAVVDATFTAGDQIAVLMAAVALGVFAPMSIPFTPGAARREPALVGSEPLSLRPVPVAGLVLIAALLLVNLVLLRPGLPIG